MFRLLASVMALQNLLVTASPADARQAEPPQLVVLIVVDQFRGDYLDRFATNLTGGLHRFRSSGIYFPKGEQDHAITATAPGHSTLLSGRVPARTGILSNDYGVPDQASPLIGGASGAGASPFRFRGTTLYDWLRAASPASRALAIARKDRGAILTFGTARVPVFWWSGDRFTTSRYYASTLPKWLEAWNAGFDPGRWAGREWRLLLPDSAYREPDDQPYEAMGAGRGNVFPHRLTTVNSLDSFPWMDSLTLDAALEGARALELGRRGVTDLLAVSLSTLDAIGHHFGPDSREVHDMVLRLDRWLGVFFHELERQLPARQILYVLTGDHGVKPIAELQRLRGARDAGRIPLDNIATRVLAPLQRRFRHRFGIDVQTGVVLADTLAMRARGVNVDSVQRELRAALARVAGVARVWTPSTLVSAADTGTARLWRRSIPPSYGWLTIVEARQNWSFSGKVEATHGSPAAYDRSVPIAFYRAGITPARYMRRVATVDIAPTLAALLGIRPLEVVDGVPIHEVLRTAVDR
jgi:predicted AlkP superfamily pyrophosphatase or phosphodiesterase